MSSTSFPTISAMDFRREPGRVLDRVDYRGESFIIERAGKGKAALVPIADFQQLRLIRQLAKEQLFTLIDKTQASVKGKNPKDVNRAIEEAVLAVRRKKTGT